MAIERQKGSRAAFRGATRLEVGKQLAVITSRTDSDSKRLTDSDRHPRPAGGSKRLATANHDRIHEPVRWTTLSQASELARLDFELVLLGHPR